MKKILITGSSGFLGSHLVDALLEKNYELILLDVNRSKYLKYQKKNKYKFKEYIKKNIEIKDLNRVLKNCFCVFHFAAIADINYAQKNPLKTINNNILFTYNLLQSCKKNNVKKIYFSSTIYVNTNYGGYYRISKETCEKLITEFCSKNNISYSILRFGSIYGERSNLSNTITNMMYQAQSNEIKREGTGNEIRNYIHVKDTVRLCLKLLNNFKKNRKYYMVIGKHPIKISTLVTYINSMYNNKLKINFSGKNKLHYSVYPKIIKEPKITVISPKKPINFWKSLNKLKNEK